MIQPALTDHLGLRWGYPPFGRYGLFPSFPGHIRKLYPLGHFWAPGSQGAERDPDGDHPRNGLDAYRDVWAIFCLCSVIAPTIVWPYPLSRGI